MNKKGFTLIELLAVIVILAIIALIATPAVLNIIEDSKESAAKDSASVIAKAAETYYVSNATLQGKDVATIDLTSDTLEYKGEKPEKGYVEFDDKGNSYLKMYMNGYCIVSDYDNTVVSTKMDSEECIMTSNTSDSIVYYIDAPVKYYDPTGQNPTCTEATAGSADGTKSGCMKWYAYAEKGNNYLMLLDHNITTSPVTHVEAVENFASYVSEWTAADIKDKRMMSALEVTELAKKYGATVEGYGSYVDTFNVEVTIGYYFNNGTDSWTETPDCTLGWLIDNLFICSNFGCNSEGTDVFDGYWLQEETGAGYWAWRIYSTAWLTFDSAAELPEYFGNGIRPVIEVPKSTFAN